MAGPGPLRTNSAAPNVGQWTETTRLEPTGTGSRIHLMDGPDFILNLDNGPAVQFRVMQQVLMTSTILQRLAHQLMPHSDEVRLDALIDALSIAAPDLGTSREITLEVPKSGAAMERASIKASSRTSSLCGMS